MSRPDITMVSAYLAPPGLPSLSPVRHDHNVALWTVTPDRVILRRYWELERITGEKHHRTPIHDAEQARRFIDSLLRTEGVRLGEVDVFVGTPGLGDDGGLTPRFAHAGLPMHSLAHLFSAIAVDTTIPRTAPVLGMALDGGPDFFLETGGRPDWYAGCIVRDGEIDYFPVESPGQLWREASRAFGREEGTLMALASACTCAVPVDAAGLLEGHTFFGADDVHRAVDAIFPRVCALVRAWLDAPAAALDDRFDLEDNFQSAVMKTVQHMSELIVDRNVGRAAERGVEPGSAYVALAGGYALNCPSNSRLLDRHGFLGLMAPPCVDDSGQALGLGLMAVHAVGGGLEGRRFTLGHAFYGPDELGVGHALDAFEDHIEDVSPYVLERAVDDVLTGEIAWVRGAAEIGPRALGHRSLLADPRSPHSKRRLNEVKQRQWWRPVAPIVLEEAVGDWFLAARPSPFMLEVFDVQAAQASRIPAALHLDGTARVQTMARDQDRVTYDLIKAFGERTGVPMLCNTSLNDRGEPIVANAAQALNFCVRKGIGVLYLDDLRVQLRTGADLPPHSLAGPQPRDRQAFADQAAQRERLWNEWIGQGLSPEDLFTYADSPQLHRRIDGPDGTDAAQLRRAVRAILRLNPRQALRVRSLADKYGPPVT